MSEDKEAIANSSQESTQEILKKILKKIHENGEGRSVYDLGNPALIAGTFDYLRLESQINDLLGKTADGRQNCGSVNTSLQGRLPKLAVSAANVSFTDAVSRYSPAVVMSSGLSYDL